MNTWKIIEEERLKLAEYLDRLSDEDWNIQSLCEEWKVRDVVAHIILESSYRPTTVLKGMVKARANPNRFMADIAKQVGTLPPAELVQKLRDVAPIRKSPPGITAREVLVDLYIHQLDIKIPLCVTKPLKKEQLQYILETAVGSKKLIGSWIVGVHRRAKGLSFRATDIDWSYGNGPEVTGTAQDLILALTGRAEGLNGLKGAGLQIFLERT